MISDADSTQAPIRFCHGLILAFALFLGLGIAVSHQSALAGVDGAREANGPPAPANDARSSGAIVVADKKDHKGNKHSNKGNNRNNEWSKHDDDWKHNHKHWNKNWSHNNNNWNKNWNKHAHVRNWYPKPYYGEFISGVVLGTLLAATGVGIVPYAPEPYLCWYWADPFMYRGYWDYCY